MAVSFPQSKLYFIGYARNGEFGLGHKHSSNEFILCPNKSITKVYPGNEFIFYTDDNFDNIWCAGNNRYGQCGISNDKEEYITKCIPITYFKKNNIKIQNIFTNPTGNCAFGKSDSGVIYGCGGDMWQLS